jgi:hypothetical protein
MNLINNFLAACIVGGLFTVIIKAIVQGNWWYAFAFITSFFFLALIGESSK